jgi:hypothetical protein
MRSGNQARVHRYEGAASHLADRSDATVRTTRLACQLAEPGQNKSDLMEAAQCLAHYMS